MPPVARANLLKGPVDDCIVCNDAIAWRIELDGFEQECIRRRPAEEAIALAQRPIGVFEVRCEKVVEERISSDVLNVTQRLNSQSLDVSDFGTPPYPNLIAHCQIEVVTSCVVQIHKAVTEALIVHGD